MFMDGNTLNKNKTPPYMVGVTRLLSIICAKSAAIPAVS